MAGEVSWDKGPSINISFTALKRKTLQRINQGQFLAKSGHFFNFQKTTGEISPPSPRQFRSVV